MSSQSGFTLIELLLSVLIMTIIAGVSLPVYESFVRRDDLDNTAQLLQSSMRRAETYARGSNYNDSWSIKIVPGSSVLYKGSNYDSRNTAYDETLPIPGSIATSGLSDITFTKMSGLPTTVGTITLASSTNDTRSLAINAKGLITY